MLIRLRGYVPFLFAYDINRFWHGVAHLFQIMVEHSSSVRCLAITDNNEIVLSGGEDGVILVCSLSLGCTEKKLSGHFDCVTVIRLSADNSIAVSGNTPIIHIPQIIKKKKYGSEFMVCNFFNPFVMFYNSVTNR